MDNDLPKGTPVLSVDFDGVIHSYSSGWKGPRCIPDRPVGGAIEFLIMAMDQFDVAIFSSRSRYPFGRWAMKRWLKKWYCQLLPHPNAVDWGRPDPLVVWLMRGAFADPWDYEVRFAAERLVKAIKWPLMKPPAMVSIDDRGWRFDGKFPAVDDLLAFRPWNKE